MEPLRGHSPYGIIHRKVFWGRGGVESWAWWVVTRIRALAATGRVRFTRKALVELYGLGLGLDESDAGEVLASLSPTESAGRTRSARSGEWMYVFKPQVSAVPLYLKVILRDECVLISFHAQGESDEEDVS